MGMTRPAALALLHGAFGKPGGLAEFAGVTATDDAAGYATAIDNALLAVGVDYDSLPGAEITGDTVPGYRAALRYYALELFESALLADVSIMPSGDGVTENASRRLDQIERAKADAAKEAGRAGVPVGPSGGARLSSIGLDIYEPDNRPAWGSYAG